MRRYAGQRRVRRTGIVESLGDAKPLALARAMAKTGSLGPGASAVKGTQKLGGAKQEVRLRRQS